MSWASVTMEVNGKRFHAEGTWEEVKLKWDEFLSQHFYLQPAEQLGSARLALKGEKPRRGNPEVRKIMAQRGVTRQRAHQIIRERKGK
jgi:hypothetical protein